MHYIFVYETLNKCNGKKYIGVHKTKRVNDGYLGSGVALNHAINKYGKENFEVTQRLFVDTYKEALEIEELIVDEDVVKSHLYYNIQLGGKNMKGEFNNFYGKKHTQESRDKMSASLKGRLSNRKGKTLNEEHGEEKALKIKEKQSKAAKARNTKPHSEETKRKIGEGNKSKPKMKCQHCDVESTNYATIVRWHNDNCKHRLNLL